MPFQQFLDERGIKLKPVIDLGEYLGRSGRASRRRGESSSLRLSMDDYDEETVGDQLRMLDLKAQGIYKN